jgi:FkbM family methyltransferase
VAGSRRASALTLGDTDREPAGSFGARALECLRRTPGFRGKGRLANFVYDHLLAPPKGPAKVKMRLGHELVMDPRGSGERLPYLTGDYDTPTIRGLTSLFEPGWVVLDVGANIGFYAIPFAVRLKQLGGRIHCFEPVPPNAARLLHNLSLNGVQDFATVWQIGLSDRKRSAAITLREDFSAGAETGNAAIAIEDGCDSQFSTAEVFLETLDGLAETVCPQRCDLIKADIEGHEDLFLRGAAQTVRKHRPVIVAEMNSWFMHRRGVDADRCLASLFDGLHYQLAVQRGRKWAHATSFKARRSETDDVLLLPEEKAGNVLFQLNKQARGLVFRS